MINWNICGMMMDPTCFNKIVKNFVFVLDK